MSLFAHFPLRPPPRSVVAAGLIFVILWFALYVLGTFIGTKPHRDILAGEAGAADKAAALVVVLFCSTPTNIAMLCCVASVMGGIFRRVRERQREGTLPPSLLVLLLSLILQGFVVYLVIIAGVISFGGWHAFLEAPTQDQYMRLAATSSLIALVIGYSPGLFNRLMGRLDSWVQERAVGRGGGDEAQEDRRRGDRN